jgi:serine/threonine-protein kinase RsbW
MALSDQMAGGGDAGGAGVPFDGFTVPARAGRLRAAEPVGDDGAVVELTVPALTGYLGVVRTATAGLAARLSFTLDEIEDLRIAVDQACVMLLSLPGPQPPGSATLTCRFRVSDEALAVAVSAWVDDRAVMPAEQSFAWQVLTAHAAEVTGHAEQGRAVVELLKRRQRR